MDSPFFLVLVGFVYIVVFGGMTVIRREHLSMRFAVEAIIITIVAAGVVYLTGINLHPVFFLAILYLITMRVRLLVDIANSFSHRKKFQIAEKLYNFAENAGTDPNTRIMVLINRGVARIQQGKLDEAIQILMTIIEHSVTEMMGMKYESACYYNLGIAWYRKGEKSKAREQFQTVVDTWPVSEYARFSKIMLKKMSEENQTN